MLLCCIPCPSLFNLSVLLHFSAFILVLQSLCPATLLMKMFYLFIHIFFSTVVVVTKTVEESTLSDGQWMGSGVHVSVL